VKFPASLAAALLLPLSLALAGGSPKAFEKYVGSFEGEGTFSDVSVWGKAQDTLESEAELSITSSPKTAEVEIASVLEDANTPMEWVFVFKRKNQCTITVRYPTGAVGTVVAEFNAKKGRITYSGTERFLGAGGGMRMGQVKGRLRFTKKRFVVYEQHTFTGETVTVRQKLDRDND